MVTVPKFRAMDESVKNLEESYTQLFDLVRKIEEQHTSLGHKLEEHMAQQSRMERGALKNNILGTPPHLIWGNTHQKQFGYVPKLEFTHFDGSHPRMRIKKAKKYFSLCKIPDDRE